MEPPSSTRLVRPHAMPERAHIAVLAPASPAESPRIERALVNLGTLGFTVTVADNAFESYRGYLAGDDRRRAGELNRLFRSSEYDAFFVTRGGYGTMRVLEQIDFDAIARNPRPIVGISDITALHQAVALKAGVATFHGPILSLDWHDGLSLSRQRWLFEMLRGEAPMTYTLERDQVIVDGSASGTVFGGCLSLVASLMGTPYDYWVDDGIWFFEDVDEPLYRIDRMLTHLRLSGRFESLRAVMIGTMKGCGGEGDRAPWDALLRDVFGGLDIPVIKDLPFGHGGDNLLIPIGAHAIVDTGRLTWTFPEPAVA